MKNIPVFTTENGVASLTLAEIPYQKKAYIRIQASERPEELLRECADFCSACGAGEIFAAGHPVLEENPLHTAMWRMTCNAESLADTDAALWPVQEITLETWREIYNEKVRKVPNGAWMTLEGGREMLQKGDGYFIHRGQALLGIGRAAVDTIDWVAAVRPGAGQDVVLALAHALTERTVSLAVASANEKAVRLYEELGFHRTGELSRWYRLK